MATVLPDPFVDDLRFFLLFNVTVWVVIGVIIGVVLFDRGVLRSPLPAVVGGVTSGLVLHSSLVYD